jgi:hypothetical protein
MNKYRITIFCGEAAIPYDVKSYYINEHGRYMVLTFNDDSIIYFMLGENVDFINVVPIEINEQHGNGI